MSRLNRRDVWTLVLASLGSALEFYDFIIFIFFAAAIAELFFPPDMPDWLRLVQAYTIFSAGYLARPLGGIIFAHFGDVVGRKRMFTLGIFLMAIPTLLIGLLPTYAMIGIWAPILLLTCRILQGAAIGGEVPGAWVFVSEHVPKQHIGLACGTLTAGLTGGILLGSLVAGAINRGYATAELLAFGWRLPFIIGGVFGLIAVYLRRYLHETPIFKEMKQRRLLSEELPLKLVIREHRPAVALTMVLTCMLSGAIVVIILMTPTLMQKLFAIPAATTLQANSIATLSLCLGCIVFGALSDRLGVGRTLMAGCTGMGAAALLLYQQLAIHSENLYTLYAVAGFFVGVVSLVPVVAVQLFPASVRFTGLSFSYNVAYAVFGGLTPVAISLALSLSSNVPAYFVVGVSMLGILTGIYLQAKVKMLPVPSR